jgi:ribonuclease P protein component
VRGCHGDEDPGKPTERHGSTKIFRRAEIFAQQLFREHHSEPEALRLSSVENVTATSAVHPRVKSLPSLQDNFKEESGPMAAATAQLKNGERKPSPFALTPPRHLYSSLALTLSTESGAAIFHAQAYIPTEPAQAKQEAWLSHAHENPGRPEGDFPPPRQGAKARFREARLPRVAFLVPLTSTVEILSSQRGVIACAALGARPDSAMPPKKAARFPRTARLLRHADFERVYKQGRRHFSASFTVFYWPRETLDAGSGPGFGLTPGLRVGFTVGRALGGAVQRNRMKRRLREAVRMSLPQPGVAADVVINPKKSLLTTDFAAVLHEVTRAFAVIEQKLSGKTDPETATKRIAGGRRPEAGRRS